MAVKKQPYRQNKRLLATIQLNRESVKNQPIPLDIQALARLEFDMYGSVIATYASGTPAAKYGSVMQSWIDVINVQRGTDSFKSVSPEMLSFENMLITKQPNLLRGSAGASSDFDPSTDITTLPYGTTGQYQNVRESLTMHFEYPYAASFDEGLLTMFRTTGLASANLQIVQKPLLNVRDDANTAPVVYSSDTLYLEVNIVEYVGDGIDLWPLNMDYRQEEKTQVYTAQTKDQIPIPRIGALSSIIISTRDGAAGSATTATSKVFNDKVLTNIQLVKNQENLVNSTFLALKKQMKSQFGYSAPKSSGVARDDGFSGIFYNKNGMKDLVDISLESGNTVLNLNVETNTSGNVTYGTSGCFVRIMTNQVAAIKK